MMPLRKKGFFMKIAIIGATQQAMLALDYFADLGVELSWFPNLEQQVQLKQKLQHTLRSEYSDELLNQKFEHSLKSHKIVWRRVQSVAKAHLHISEQIGERSRMCDLFRITTVMNAQSVIQEQMQNNQNLFGNLKPDVVESLMSEQDSFEDFDVVIDTTLFEGHVEYINGVTPIMGESRLKNFPGLYYGTAGLEFLNSPLADDIREIAIIGSNDLAANILNLVIGQLEHKLDRIFIITREEHPFAAINEGPLKQQNRLNLDKELQRFKQQTEIFEKKHREWLELESYMQAKIPRPTEPIPNLVFFSGHSVIALDRLIDRDRFYLTCEIPEFRQAHLQKENAELPLKTIGVDAIFVADGISANQNLYRSLRTIFWNESSLPLQPEDGFYTLGFKALAHQLGQIEANLMTFFSRKDN